MFSFFMTFWLWLWVLQQFLPFGIFSFFDSVFIIENELFELFSTFLKAFKIFINRYSTLYIYSASILLISVIFHFFNHSEHFCFCSVDFNFIVLLSVGFCFLLISGAFCVFWVFFSKIHLFVITSASYNLIQQTSALSISLC